MGSIFNVIAWIIFGAIIGGLAQFLIPGKQNLGWIATIGLGIVGSFFGGFIWSLLFSGAGQFAYLGWISSLVGATLLLFIYVQLTKRR